MARKDLTIFVNAAKNEYGKASYTLSQDHNAPHQRVKDGDEIWTYWNELIRVEFAIRDNTGLHLEFRDEGDGGPIWIKKGKYPEDCPASRYVDSDYGVANVRKHRFILENPASGKLQTDYVFRLRIVDKDGGEQDYDPVISNGGGGIEEPFEGPGGISLALVLVSLIAVAALIGLAWFAGLFG